MGGGVDEEVIESRTSDVNVEISLVSVTPPSGNHLYLFPLRIKPLKNSFQWGFGTLTFVLHTNQTTHPATCTSHTSYTLM